MMVYVVRHAQAEKLGSGATDEARKLTPRGRIKMREAALGMAALGLKFDVILTSPLVRAVETAKLIAEAYGDDVSPQVVEALATGVPATQALTALAPHARNESVAVVGHEPQLGELVSLLLTGSSDRLRLRLKKGACVAIELPRRIEPGSGQLCWMLTQRHLRRLAK